METHDQFVKWSVPMKFKIGVGKGKHKGNYYTKKKRTKSQTHPPPPKKTKKKKEKEKQHIKLEVSSYSRLQHLVLPSGSCMQVDGRCHVIGCFPTLLIKPICVV
ncbi:hypothetical protein Ancab_004046 [Ancistrocladus abbreviatus]